MSQPPAMPFIMPDGSRLSMFISDAKTDVRRGRKATRDFVSKRTQAQHDEDFERGLKLGARRQLRWLNDRLLREMAGPMTAAEMAGLFNPAPFGESRVSPLQVALQQAPALWDALRNIGIDKEDKVFQRWEEHVHSGARGSESRHADEVAALQAWDRVSQRARAALRKLDLHDAHDAEVKVQAFMTSVQWEALLESKDAFERLVLHGLAAFYHLHSHSVNTSSGRAVLLRKSATSAASQSSVRGSSVPAPESRSCSETHAAARSSTFRAQSSSSAGASNSGQQTGCHDAPSLEAQTESEHHASREQPSDACGSSSPAPSQGGAQPAEASGQTGQSARDEDVELQGCPLPLPAYSVVDVLMVLDDSRSSGTGVTLSSLGHHRRNHFPSHLVAA